MRDDFTSKIKEILAKRVAMHCSNPDCTRVTSGPLIEPNKVANIGVAAHISAASPGGARYDAAMTAEQRSAISNAIWLCQSCAKLIDGNPQKFTVALLQEWKVAAESYAEAELELRPDREKLAADVALLRFYRQCFDRPVFQDTFLNEGSMEHFDKAIEDTITALNTGTLLSRDGVILAQANGKSFLVNIEWREQFDIIVDLLRAIRSRYKWALRTGEIYVHDSSNGEQFYAIHGHAVARWIDHTRAEVVGLFSKICAEANLPGLKFPRTAHRRYFDSPLNWEE